MARVRVMGDDIIANESHKSDTHTLCSLGHRRGGGISRVICGHQGSTTSSKKQQGALSLL